MTLFFRILFVTYGLLILAGILKPVVHALHRRWIRRRCVRLLSEYSKSVLADQSLLEIHAELSRWVTANTLLAAHRELRRGIEARA